MAIVFIDSFAFNQRFNLNFYKIFSFFTIPYLKSAFKTEKLSLIFISLFSLVSGIFFLVMNPTVIDPSSSSQLDLPLIRIFRNQFTIITTLLISYRIYLMMKEYAIHDIFRSLELIGALVSISMLAEIIFEKSIFGFLTGGNYIVYGVDYLRAKGLSFEPRGAGQIMAICVISSLFFSKTFYFVFLVPIYFISLYLSASHSGFVMVVVGLILIGIRLSWKFDWAVVSRFFYASLICIITLLLLFNAESKQYDLSSRSYLFTGTNSGCGVSLICDAIGHFEVFDAAYLNFLYHNPLYILIGTGSGMGGFASQSYVLAKDIGLFPQGSTALPLMGGVYMISQFGLVLSIFLISVSCKNLVLSYSDSDFFLFIVVILFLLQYYYLLPFLFAIYFHQSSLASSR